MRGVIDDRERSRQINCFKDMRWGKITPTDFDGFIDFGNNAFFLIEIKYGNAKMPFGQQLAFERIVDNLDIAKNCAGLLLKHNIHDTLTDVEVAKLIVYEYRWNREWIKPSEKIKCKDAIDKFLNIWGLNYVKK